MGNKLGYGLQSRIAMKLDSSYFLHAPVRVLHYKYYL